jgi:hypothetical protein
MELLQTGIQRRVSGLPSIQDASTLTNQGPNAASIVAIGGTLPWVLRIWGQFGKGLSYVGAVRVFPRQGSRLVAVVSAPGARWYEIEGVCSTPVGTSAIDEMGIEIHPCVAAGGAWGVQPVLGNSVDGARSYRVLTGASGVVAVTGEVFGWAARSVLAGATIAVAAGPALGFGPIGVPQNGEVHGDARGLMAPVSTWTFTNTSGYVIEYVPPGPIFDG